MNAYFHETSSSNVFLLWSIQFFFSLKCDDVGTTIDLQVAQDIRNIRPEVQNERVVSRESMHLYFTWCMPQVLFCRVNVRVSTQHPHWNLITVSVTPVGIVLVHFTENIFISRVHKSDTRIVLEARTLRQPFSLRVSDISQDKWHLEFNASVLT